MNKDIADGEVAFVQGSAKKPYELKNIGGVFSCSCPAWRNQSKCIDERTCKHLKKYRGEAVELARLGQGPAVANAPAPKKSVAMAAKQAQAAIDKPPLLLAHKWTTEDPTGMMMSEKLDGVRAWWNGKDFISRLGNIFFAPDWFKAGLPEYILDGELWVGRGKFQKAVSIVRRKDGGDKWKDVKYVIFDVPGKVGWTFDQRMSFLNKKKFGSYANVLHQTLCLNTTHLEETLLTFEKMGGEGVMLRDPESLYEDGRSHTLLKVKTFHDSEATVIGYGPGKGRHKGRVGKLIVENADGVEFGLGSGLSDEEREYKNAPPLGSLVTYRYQELTNDGVPRFPTFLRLAENV